MVPGKAVDLIPSVAHIAPRIRRRALGHIPQFGLLGGIFVRAQFSRRHRLGNRLVARCGRRGEPGGPQRLGWVRRVGRGRSEREPEQDNEHDDGVTFHGFSLRGGIGQPGSRPTRRSVAALSVRARVALWSHARAAVGVIPSRAGVGTAGGCAPSRAPRKANPAGPADRRRKTPSAPS